MVFSYWRRTLDEKSAGPHKARCIDVSRRKSNDETLEADIRRCKSGCMRCTWCINHIQPAEAPYISYIKYIETYITRTPRKPDTEASYIRYIFRHARTHERGMIN